MNLSTTKHAEARIQQRSIPPAIIDWLLDFGARERSQGCDIVFFDKKAKKRMSQELGPQIVKCISKFLDVYAIISNDGDVVTAGHRFKHIKRQYIH